MLLRRVIGSDLVFFKVGIRAQIESITGIVVKELEAT